MLSHPTLIVSMLIYFILGWIYSVKTNKYAWLDFVWASGFFLPLIHLVRVEVVAMEGAVDEALLILMAMYVFWSVRLSALLWRRIQREGEDSRYRHMKESLGAKAPLVFLILFVVEGGLVLWLCLPLALQHQPLDSSLSWNQYLSVVMFSLCLWGGSLADQQLATFKKQYKGQKRVCNVGLWRYSRHPNYFFEILLWFSFGIFTLHLENGFWGLGPGLTMFFLIYKVTGVPHSERQALAHRGDIYRKYQETTSVLIPWPPKEQS